MDVNTSTELIPLVASTSLEVLESGVLGVRGVLTRAVVVILVYVGVDCSLLLMAFRKGGVVRADLCLNSCFICFANLRTKLDVLELKMDQ